MGRKLSLLPGEISRTCGFELRSMDNSSREKSADAILAVRNEPRKREKKNVEVSQDSEGLGAPDKTLIGE